MAIEIEEIRRPNFVKNPDGTKTEITVLERRPKVTDGVMMQHMKRTAAETAEPETDIAAALEDSE